MADSIVEISKVADGSMLNRHDPKDSAVIKNRQAYLAGLNITMDQTTRLNTNTLQRATEQGEKDWCRYHEVTSTEKGAGMLDDDVVAADALITRQSGHALMLPVADCTGTVIYDPKNHVLMLTHLGRHSLEQSGGKKSIEYLANEYGSDPADLKVWLTPSPSKEVFPIWALDNQGMKEVVFQQLKSAGIKSENITDNPSETDKDPDYFSYTEFYNGRAAVDGDHAIVAMMIDEVS